jgi:hypothetical protein
VDANGNLQALAPLAGLCHKARHKFSFQSRRASMISKGGKVTASVKELAQYSMLMTEAIFELLAEKGLLTGEEVKERIKKLRAETTINFRWLQ